MSFGFGKYLACVNLAVYGKKFLITDFFSIRKFRLTGTLK